MQIDPRDDGRFEVADRIFDSQEAAQLYLDSRTRKQSPVSGIEKPDWGKVLSLIFAAPVAFYVVSCVMSPNETTPQQVGMSQAGALMLCQEALKRASRDPSTADVPYVDDQGGGGEFYFAWGGSTKPVRMKNGMGALMSAGASCTVNKKTGKVTTVTLDGKSVI